MTNTKIIKICIAVAMIHFILTSLVGHYMAVQVGTEMGQVVAGGLIAASEAKSGNAEKDAKKIVQNMKTKSDEIRRGWQIPALLISLPVEPFIDPALKEMRQNRINKVINGKISRDQFLTQGLLIDYTVRLLNSLFLGLVLYLGVRLSIKFKKERSRQSR